MIDLVLTYVGIGAVIAEWFERTHEDHPGHWAGVLSSGIIWPVTVVVMVMTEPWEWGPTE